MYHLKGISMPNKKRTMKDEYVWQNLNLKLEELQKELERDQKIHPAILKKIYFDY